MEMMKKIKENDWTRILQDRLQGARLPLEDDVFPALSGVGGDGGARTTPAGVWWPWALAGAAAAVAAVLLLRPVVKPAQEPVRLVQQTEPVEILPPPGPEVPTTRNAGNFSSSAGSTGETSTPAAAMPDTTAFTPDLTRSLPVENDVSAPDTIRPRRATPPLSELVLADLGGGPEETGRPGRKPAGRASLRVQAATSGTSFSGGSGGTTLPVATLEPGRWIEVSNSAFATNIISDDSPVPPGESQWVYVRDAPGTGIELVLVQEAPVIPVSFGVSLSLLLTRSWTLSAGIDYMQRDGYRLYGNTPQSLTLHYLGVPVDLQYYVNPSDCWRFYLGAGVHAAKCIYATGGEPLRDPVLFSGNVTAGTDFRLFPGVRFYLAPALSGHFNRSAYINSWDDKLQFQLRAGLSFELK